MGAASTSSKKYECELCQFKSNNLSSHMAVKHPSIETFNCKQCPFLTVEIENLHHHLYESHGVDMVKKLSEIASIMQEFEDNQLFFIGKLVSGYACSYTMIGSEGVMHSMIEDAPPTAHLFAKFIDELPEFPPIFNIVLDDSSCHTSDEATEALSKYSGNILFLPEYFGSSLTPLTPFFEFIRKKHYAKLGLEYPKVSRKPVMLRSFSDG